MYLIRLLLVLPHYSSPVTTHILHNLPPSPSPNRSRPTNTQGPVLIFLRPIVGSGPSKLIDSVRGKPIFGSMVVRHTDTDTECHRPHTQHKAHWKASESFAAGQLLAWSHSPSPLICCKEAVWSFTVIGIYKSFLSVLSSCINLPSAIREEKDNRLSQPTGILFLAGSPGGWPERHRPCVNIVVRMSG